MFSASRMFLRVSRIVNTFKMSSDATKHFRNLIFSYEKVYLVSSKKVTRFTGLLKLILKSEKLIYQAKADLDEKIFFGIIIHHSDPENWEMLVKGVFGNDDSTFHSGP